MIESGSSLVLCAFSATSFNTASPVDPDWHDFLTHIASLLTIMGVVGAFMIMLGLPNIVGGLRRRLSPYRQVRRYRPLSMECVVDKVQRVSETILGPR
jgi:hypothetical protein